MFSNRAIILILGEIEHIFSVRMDVSSGEPKVFLTHGVHYSPNFFCQFAVVSSFTVGWVGSVSLIVFPVGLTLIELVKMGLVIGGMRVW